MAEKYYFISPYAYVANNPVNMIDPNGMGSDWVEDKYKHVYWNEQATSQVTTASGETYIGKTVYATNEDGGFRYGDQFGNWHDSASLGEVSVTGFQTSGSGPVSSAIRSAASGYDPQWIDGFNKFVEGGLKAIEYSLMATTLAAEAGSLSSGNRVRATLKTVDDAAKGSTQTVYRVFGDEAKALSKSWAPVNPNSVVNYRNAAGLPVQNTGRFVIEGTVNKADIILQRGALPLNGNTEGLMEYIIDPTKVIINRVSGVN